MTVALAVALGALAQSVSGIGFVLVCGPALVAALGQAEGVRLAVLLSLAVNVAVLARGAQHVRLRAALLLLAPAALATPALARLLHAAPPRLAEALAGAAALVGATALARGVRWPAARSTPGAAAAGVLSAAMNVTAGIGGPAVALWAENAGWPPARTRSTLQVYFLGLNLVALVSLGLPRSGGGTLGAAALALGLGLVAGSALAGRVPPVLARRVTLALAAAGGALVLARALTGS